MKTKRIWIAVLAFGLLVTLTQGGVTEAAVRAAAVGTAFTYQGRLADAGGPVNDDCDFQFGLWDAAGSGEPPTGGAQIGTTQTRTDVEVSAGLFVVQLDFGAGAFGGDARWLQIAVRCPAGSGDYTILAPRQPLTPAPYALYSSAAPWSGLTGVPTGFADGVDDDTTYTAGTGLTLSGGAFSVDFAGAGSTTTVARSDHDHWGQSWSGSGAGLTLSSIDNTGIVVTSAGGDGLHVGEAGNPSSTATSMANDGVEVEGAEGNGMVIGRADSNGLYVHSSGYHGLSVDFAGYDGVHVDSVGSPSTTNTSSEHNGFEVAGAAGYGLYVGRADLDGVYVRSAGDDAIQVDAVGGFGLHIDYAANGVVVEEAGGHAIRVVSAGGTGMYVHEAGDPSTTGFSLDNNGFQVNGAEGNGVFVGRADEAGVYVASAGDDGVHATGGSGDGDYGGWFQGYTGVYGHGTGSGGYGGHFDSDSSHAVYVEGSGAAGDGVHVASTGRDGVHVADADDYGVYVAAAGLDGVHVESATGNGVYANTAAANHEWGFYTPDRIYAGTSLVNGGALMFVAQNGAARALETGDVVAVNGVGTPLAASTEPVPLVRKDDSANGSAVIGVVYRRFAVEKQVEGSGPEQQTAFHAYSTPGPVAPGDYMLIVVLGPAQVKTGALAGDIRPGDPLTAAGSGRVAKATPVEVDGVAFYPPGVIFGKAMEASDTAQSDGLIWVWVTLR